MRQPPSWEIFDCDEKRGANSIQAFIMGLPLKAKGEALAFLKLLEEFGDTLKGSLVTDSANGSFELCGHYVRLRYKVSSNQRIYLLAVMLAGNANRNSRKD